MATPTGQNPHIPTVTMLVAALAANASADLPAFVAPFDGTVTKVEVIPAAAITGANTNSRNHVLVNKGQAGAGSTVIASRNYVSGVNAPAYDATALTLSGTAANLDVAAGDVLAVQSTAVGTGIADPGTLFLVTIARA